MGIEYEKKGKIAIITFNRPEVMNAVNAHNRRELVEIFKDFQNDPKIWVGIITGTGEKAFCAGADLSSPDVTNGEPHAENPDDTVINIGNGLTKPLIAAINGYCLGFGMETALICDIRIAAEHARLGLPEVTRGLIPLEGGPLKLPRMINWCHAAEMLLTGKHIDAQKALSIGLINEVVPLDKLMPTAMEWAELICEASPLAVRAAKEVMVKGFNMTIPDGSRMVRSMMENLRNTEDSAEGRRAFVERRKPNYKGQ